MSEFEKTLRKHNVFDRTLKTDDPKKILIDIFQNWKSPEDYLELEREIEKLKADKQLVVVPKFVAEWYEKMITGTFSAVISSYAFRPEFDSVKWVNKNGGMNFLCKMFLYGYAVEKEKLYVLEFPRQLNTYVAKVNSNGVITHYSSEIYDALKLTGKEIKAIDVRYWSFAVPVDEVTDD